VKSSNLAIDDFVWKSNRTSPKSRSPKKTGDPPRHDDTSPATFSRDKKLLALERQTQNLQVGFLKKNDGPWKMYRFTALNTVDGKSPAPPGM